MGLESSACPTLKASQFPDLYITTTSYGNADWTNFRSLPSSRGLLFVLSPGKVAGKVVPVSAPVPTDVTLERIFIAMATHVNGVENIIWEVDVAVRTVVEQLRLVARVWCSGLAVSATVARRARSVTALPPVGRVPNVWHRRESHNRTGDVAGNGG